MITLAEGFDWATRPLTETLDALLEIRGLDADLRRRAALMRSIVADPKFYHRSGRIHGAEGDRPNGIAVRHLLPGRLLRKISNRPTTAFVSATLSIGESFRDFMNLMAIAKESRFSDRLEPEHHGDLRVFLQPDADPAAVIAEAARPCLVVMTSFKTAASFEESQTFEDIEAFELAEALKAAEALRAKVPGAVVRDASENNRQAYDRMSAAGADVLIAVAAWAGLDLPVQWASIVVPKIPFGPPMEVEGKIHSSYIDSRNVGIRRMRQVIGRGLRHPDAACDLHLLDGRHAQIAGFLPPRFKDRLTETWAEGGRRRIELSKVERDPRVRRYVLNHHGVKCLACEDPKLIEPQIEVHHLNPIAEGERRTKLEEVVPLCANCHRRAHTESPPIPLEKLRDIARA